MITTFSPKKFTEQAAKKLDSSVKPEPWLHVAVLGIGNNQIYARTKKPEDAERVIYAVYVWDTRKVVEVKSIDFSKDSRAATNLQFYFAPAKKGRNAKFSQIYHAMPAKDNGKPLQGGGEEVRLINEYIFKNK